MTDSNLILQKYASLLCEQLLIEAMSLQDIKQKWYPNIEDDIFLQIVQSDPTYKQESSNKMGQYGKWLLNLYKQGNLKTEDLYKATKYLEVFDKAKRMKRLDITDINKFKTLPDLYNVVKQFMANENTSAEYNNSTELVSQRDRERQTQSEAEKVYESNNWLIIVPHTKEAAIKYGKNTEWCTAATGSYNYFDYYNKQGNLYILISKFNRHKYQFHFETDSFMDETDSRIDFEEDFGWGSQRELLDFFKQEKPNDWFALIYDEHEKDSDVRSLTRVGRKYEESNNCEYNLVSPDGEELSDIWFDTISDFSCGWARVTPSENEDVDWYYNYVGTDGQLYSEEGFYDAGNFNEGGFAVVQKTSNDEEIIICAYKDYISYSKVVEKYDGFSIIEYNGMKKIEVNNRNKHDEDFDNIEDKWYHNINVKETEYGTYIIAKGYRCSFEIINASTMKCICCGLDNVLDFSDGMFNVETFRGSNYVNTDGKFISDECFDETYPFNNGYALVINYEDGKEMANFINKNGKLTFRNWLTEYEIGNDKNSLIVPYDGRQVTVDGTGTIRMFEGKQRAIRNYLNNIINEALFK